MYTDHRGNVVRVGDTVTTKGRTGWGQPLVIGKLVAIKSGVCEIEIHPGITRKRSARNVRLA